MSASHKKTKKRPQPLYTGIEGDKTHHLTGPFLPQTPLGGTPRSASPAFRVNFTQRSAFIRWAIDPALSFKICLLPVILWLNWKLLAPYADPGAPNPFSIFLISGYIPTSSPEDPRYRKTWWDIPFIMFYVVFFSFVRQTLAIRVSRPLAKYFGLRSEGKLDRFGEQMYAFLYFMVFGAWGYRVMLQLPTYWYKTSALWEGGTILSSGIPDFLRPVIGYPHWDMKPDLKAYYLVQFGYWWQQLVVLVLGLEKPRKDYHELVAHHFVTLWLIGWSYLVNLTLIGNAVYMSMDIPDTFLAFSKLLNYIQWNTAKVYAFGIFFAIWTYFRHYLNILILWSVWFEEPTLPQSVKHWSWEEGVYLPNWMKYQIFIPLFLLQCLNLFWYYYMFKILVRGLMTNEVDDHRSDDEGDDDDNADDKKND
ncbi:longevity assurance proteins LAG1/LAC1 [Pholiota conissans]|uniref:Longevity assurance proteins LAG1/LAC1 n=1 Tax=Pholiota conissans TaxID=109636 RepID=A0A9P5ZD58_9AGAR|nr:longevity assurance proteins LAG1/LAC1 [Pholiota conissans]